MPACPTGYAIVELGAKADTSQNARFPPTRLRQLA